MFFYLKVPDRYWITGRFRLWCKVRSESRCGYSLEIRLYHVAKLPWRWAVAPLSQFTSFRRRCKDQKISVFPAVSMVKIFHVHIRIKHYISSRCNNSWHKDVTDIFFRIMMQLPIHHYKLQNSNNVWFTKSNAIFFIALVCRDRISSLRSSTVTFPVT